MLVYCARDAEGGEAGPKLLTVSCSILQGVRDSKAAKNTGGFRIEAEAIA